MMIRKSLAALLLIFLVSCRESPPEQENPTVLTGHEMTADYKISFGKVLQPDEITKVQTIVKRTFEEVDTLYNRFNPHSEISQMNEWPAEKKGELSAEMEHLLELSQQLVDLSGGRYDPTIEPLHSLWKKHGKEGSIQSKEEIEETMEGVGWEKIHFKNGYFTKDYASTRLVGGIVKGLTIDILIERLILAGYPDVLVEWGGQIRASGTDVDGKDWEAVVNGTEKIVLKDQAIATRSREEFVLNPHSKMLLKAQNGAIYRVTVLAPSGALADGLTIAGLTFESIAEAKMWSEQLQEMFPEIVFWFAILE